MKIFFLVLFPRSSFASSLCIYFFIYYRISKFSFVNYVTPCFKTLVHYTRKYLNIIALIRNKSTLSRTQWASYVNMQISPYFPINIVIIKIVRKTLKRIVLMFKVLFPISIINNFFLLVYYIIKKGTEHRNALKTTLFKFF